MTIRSRLSSLVNLQNCTRAARTRDGQGSYVNCRLARCFFLDFYWAYTLWCSTRSGYRAPLSRGSTGVASLRVQRTANFYLLRRKKKKKRAQSTEGKSERKVEPLSSPRKSISSPLGAPEKPAPPGCYTATRCQLIFFAASLFCLLPIVAPLFSIASKPHAVVFSPF